METVLRSLRRAAQDLLTPRMLGLLLWPMGAALLFWGAIAWGVGPTWATELTAYLATTPLHDLMLWAGAEWLVAYAAIGILILLWLPAVYVTALLVTSLALMPFIVGHVAARYYPALERQRGGTLAGSAVNGLAAMAMYLVAWLVLLPLWLFAPFGILVSLLLNAWLNQRMFMYDALSEHASAGELRPLRHAGGLWLYALAALLGALSFVPLLNLFVPVYMGLAFTHFALEALDRSRRGVPA